MTKEKMAKTRKTRQAYLGAIGQLVQQPRVLEMGQYMQHGRTSCLEHSIFVSYCSFLVCRRLGWDARSAARGALLHDFFLYDWHQKGERQGLHGFTHAKKAWQNANQYFELSGLEQNIIRSHMWPLGLILPLSAEAWLVWAVDKFCTTVEVLGGYRLFWQQLRLRPVLGLVTEGFIAGGKD